MALARVRIEPNTEQTNVGVESTPRDTLCRAMPEPSHLPAATALSVTQKDQ